MAQKKETKVEYTKRRTLELYDMLPQAKAERMKRLDIRDQVIELNYSFFGYIATHTFINNSSISYEDKFQSALMHFCECWWWYKWQGDDTHKGYRTDISFTSFFKPRIGEMIERELNEVKYSVRRTLCMEAGKQLGKHWGQVKYEDLKDVNLPADKMDALKSIFGTLYTADLETHVMFMEAPNCMISEFDDLSDEYNSIEELLIHEMIEYEKPLSEEDLKKMADIYSLDIYELKEKYPIALQMLRTKLENNIALNDAMYDN